MPIPFANYRLSPLLFFFGLLLTVSLFTAPLPALAAPHGEKVNYLALGNSLAAGQNPYGQIDKGYPDYLAEKMQQLGYLHAYSNAFAVPGYTTEDVLRDIVDNRKQNGVTLQDSIRQANIITLDAGANDLLHVVKVHPSGLAYDLRDLPSIYRQIGNNLQQILRQIHQLNPSADVFVMGYYNAFPYLGASFQAELLPLLDKLNDTIRTAAAKEGATFVPVADAIAANPQAYIPNPLDIHPSPAGYQVLAQELWKEVHKQFPLRRLSVSQRSIRMQPGEQLPIQLIAMYRNDREETVTHLAEWRSSDQRIAIMRDGYIIARKKGNVELQAHYGNKHIRVFVVVK